MPIFNIQPLKFIKIRNILRYQGQIVCGSNGRDLAICKGRGHPCGCEPGKFLGMPLGCPVVVWKDGQGWAKDIEKQVLKKRALFGFGQTYTSENELVSNNAGHT